MTGHASDLIGLISTECSSDVEQLWSADDSTILFDNLVLAWQFACLPKLDVGEELVPCLTNDAHGPPQEVERGRVVSSGDDRLRSVRIAQMPIGGLKVGQIIRSSRCVVHHRHAVIGPRCSDEVAHGHVPVARHDRNFLVLLTHMRVDVRDDRASSNFVIRTLVQGSHGLLLCAAERLGIDLQPQLVDSRASDEPLSKFHENKVHYTGHPELLLQGKPRHDLHALAGEIVEPLAPRDRAQRTGVGRLAQRLTACGQNIIIPKE